MNEFLTLLLREVEAGWVWMYTAGMPEAARQDRVAELESDAWEHEQAARIRSEPFRRQYLYRVVRGIPADLGWRLAQGRSGFEGRNWLEVLVAGLIVFGLVVGVPISGFVLPTTADASAGGAFAVLAAIHALLLILLLVLPGILVIERYPIAGGLLTQIGCLCLMALFWWFREAMAVIVIGSAAAGIAAIRLHRLPPN